MTEPILTADAVSRIFDDCVVRYPLNNGTEVYVEGIVHGFYFLGERLAVHEAAIGALLAELPTPFRADKHGWSFLNACYDRHDREWTDLRWTMERLFALGIATGQAEWLTPRELWDACPGGMPYVVVRPIETSSSAAGSQAPGETGCGAKPQAHASD